MLFLYRPRQTYLPIQVPQNMRAMQQTQYNRDLQNKFGATRQVEPTVPAEEPDTVTQLKDLAELHASGALTDNEFAAAKAKVLGGAQ